MTTLVSDTGFSPDTWTRGFSGPHALDLPCDTDPDTLTFDAQTEIIRIAFPGFADGRGFTLARLLRLRGYSGRLRAAGPVLADQYAMARRAGFDEVEIPDDIAVRQPEPQWLARADWRQNDYQSRLRGS